MRRDNNRINNNNKYKLMLLKLMTDSLFIAITVSLSACVKVIKMFINYKGVTCESSDKNPFCYTVLHAIDDALLVHAGCVGKICKKIIIAALIKQR